MNASTCPVKEDRLVLTKFSVLTTVICIGVALLLLGIVIGRLRGSKKAAFLHRQAIDKQLELIRKALDSQSGDGQLQFPFVIIRAQDFLTARGLLSHEELRREGRLVVIDTLTQLKHFERKQRIIFFSHQWTAYREPDPNNIHFRTMVAALQRVQTANNWPLERMFVWCDYCSVPQAHRPTMELAIKSLAVYSSRAHAFIAVVPIARHADTGEKCDAESYKLRLWTRAECLTHLLVNGSDSMWVATGAKSIMCQRMPPEWLKGSSICIFTGQSSCCQWKHAGMDHCDRELLVQPLLGLYGGLYAEAKEQGLVDRSRGRHASRFQGRKISHRMASLDSISLDQLRVLADELTPAEPTRRWSDNIEGPTSIGARAQGLLSMLARRASLTNGGLGGLVEASASSVGSSASMRREKMHEYELIAQFESEVFPRQFGFATDDHPDGMVMVDLFGGLIPLMKMIIDQDSRLRHLLNQQRSRLQTRRRQFDLRMRTNGDMGRPLKRGSVSTGVTSNLCQPCEQETVLRKATLQSLRASRSLSAPDMDAEAAAASELAHSRLSRAAPTAAATEASTVPRRGVLRNSTYKSSGATSTTADAKSAAGAAAEAETSIRSESSGGAPERESTGMQSFSAVSSSKSQSQRHGRTRHERVSPERTSVGPFGAVSSGFGVFSAMLGGRASQGGWGFGLFTRESRHSTASDAGSAARSSCDQPLTKLWTPHMDHKQLHEHEKHRHDAKASNHRRVSSEKGDLLALDKDFLANVEDEADSFNQSGSKISLDAKLKRRWSFSAQYGVVKLDATRSDFAAPEFLGGDVRDRLTLAATVGRLRREAEWLDGEKEYSADSYRHQNSSRLNVGMNPLRQSGAPAVRQPSMLRQRSFLQRPELQRTYSRQLSSELKMGNHRQSEVMTFDHDTIKFWKTVATRASDEMRKSHEDRWTLARFRQSTRTELKKRRVSDALRFSRRNTSRNMSMMPDAESSAGLHKKLIRHMSFWLGGKADEGSPSFEPPPPPPPRSSFRQPAADVTRAEAAAESSVTNPFTRRPFRPSAARGSSAARVSSAAIRESMSWTKMRSTASQMITRKRIRFADSSLDDAIPGGAAAGAATGADAIGLAKRVGFAPPTRAPDSRATPFPAQPARHDNNSRTTPYPTRARDDTPEARTTPWPTAEAPARGRARLFGGSSAEPPNLSVV